MTRSPRLSPSRSAASSRLPYRPGPVRISVGRMRSSPDRRRPRSLPWMTKTRSRPGALAARSAYPSRSKSSLATLVPNPSWPSTGSRPTEPSSGRRWTRGAPLRAALDDHRSAPGTVPSSAARRPAPACPSPLKSYGMAGLTGPGTAACAAGVDRSGGSDSETENHRRAGGEQEQRDRDGADHAVAVRARLRRRRQGERCGLRPGVDHRRAAVVGHLRAARSWLTGASTGRARRPRSPPAPAHASAAEAGRSAGFLASIHVDPGPARPPGCPAPARPAAAGPCGRGSRGSPSASGRARTAGGRPASRRP